VGALTWGLGLDPYEQLKYGSVRHWVLWFLVRGRRSAPPAPLLTSTVWRYGGLLHDVTIDQAKTLASRQLYLRAGQSFPESNCSDCRVVGVGIAPLGDHGPTAWTEMATTRFQFNRTIFA
jgi:hypothetical protein